MLLGEIQRLRKQVHQLQLERDILTKANELIKKDWRQLSETEKQEKTLIVDALKKKYPVAELLSVLQLARSCYFYHKASKRLYDKYAEIRVIMADIFEENYRCYYRRLHAMLRSNNRVISEKVVRRLMAEEQLVVKRTRRRRYNSYCGEIVRHRKIYSPGILVPAGQMRSG
jgi:c-di-AMP phosphodiesterase-like protein